MRLTQLLSIEITTECNLANKHTRCPVLSPDRFRHLNTVKKLDDHTIVSVVIAMYRDYGFRGMVAWHYYCEPLLEQDRILRLMAEIKTQVPEARFLLWTNGTLVPENVAPLQAFDRIVITDYGDLNPDRVQSLLAIHPGTSVHRWPLDGRLKIRGPATSLPCGRMFAEFVIDAFGNVHLCCYDWKGLASIGNVHTHSLSCLVDRWQKTRDAISGKVMTDAAPTACRQCSHKAPGIAPILPPIVASPNIVRDANDYLSRLRSSVSPPRPTTRPSPPAEKPTAASRPPIPVAPLPKTAPLHLRKIAVVFVSYLKVPTKRLREHFRWNAYWYRRSKARVYVVTEKQRRVPNYAECVVYPQELLPEVNGKKRFSICATKNAGIKKAIADGADVVVCIDVDHAFSKGCWQHLVAVGDGAAAVPCYRMIAAQGDYRDSHIDTGATGVVAMTAQNWRRIQWDERCIGYGADDGIMLNSIRKAGLRIDRDAIIDHVEHPGAVASKNVPGHGRIGCYGRDEFNFDNFLENREIYREGK